MKNIIVLIVSLFVATISFGMGAPVTAGDCDDAVNVCTDITFEVDADGFGSTNELPTSGTVSNPSTNPSSGNSGCLLSGETNSTWMVVNVATTGDLEFTFGGGGAQAGYYDWAMWPYDATTCTDIQSNTIAPVSCNWNGTSLGGTGLAATVPAGGSASNFEPPLAVTAGDQFIICFSNYSSVATNVPLDFNGTASVSCLPLPIDLLNFDVELKDQKVEIAWSTLSEINNDFFVVERSEDGIDFNSVEIVYGSGNSATLINYKQIDENPIYGINYYRLKQIDFDGEHSYSSIVSINIEETEDVRMYPNPAKQHIIIEGVLAGSTIEIYNTMGRPVLKKELKFEKEVIDTENIPEGVYFVKISNDMDVLVKKMNIIH